MRTLLDIKINARAVASPRPRLGKSKTFMPKKYTEHKKLIQSYFAGFKMLPKIPLHIEINCFFREAKSSKYNKYPVPNKDVDNLAKTYLDAMNKIVYEDDVLVESLTVTKKYADVDKIFIRIRG